MCENKNKTVEEKKKRGTRRDDESHNDDVARRAKERYESDPEHVASMKLKYYTKKFKDDDEFFNFIWKDNKSSIIALQKSKVYSTQKRLDKLNIT